MQNKKTAIAIVIFAVVAFLLVALFVLYKPTSEKDVKNNVSEVIENLPELVCDYESDDVAYKDAFDRKDVNQCECIENEGLKNTCKSVLLDTMFYDRALAQLDLALCENIYSEVQKESCIMVVKDSVEQFENEDPQYLADIYAEAHNEKAIAEYEKITQTEKENIDNFLNLALAYAEKGLSEQNQGRDQEMYVNKAFASIENAKKIDQNNAEVYRIEGYINEIKPDYNQAIELYNQAIALDENNALAYVGRGHTYRMIGMLEQAIEDFNRAAELDVNKIYVSIYTNLCNLEYSRAHNEDAIKNCKIVIQMDGSDPVFQSDAYQIMARMLMNDGDLQQAKNYLLQAKTVTPHDASLYITLAKLNLFEQDYVDSENNAHKAIDLVPTKALGYLALANALYMQDKYEQSIVEAEKGISLVADDVSLLTPSKIAVEEELNYIISNNYRNLGNTEKQGVYEQKALDLSTENNQLTITK